MAKHQWIYAATPMALLASCGGGGSTGSVGQPIAITPAPAPTTSPSPLPTQTPARIEATDKIIGAAASSQTFAYDGRQLFTDGEVIVSFDAATGTYRITDPGNTTPSLLSRASDYRPLDGEPWLIFVGDYGFNFQIRASTASTAVDYRYDYSNLAAWGSLSFQGQTAFGIPTPPGLGPSQSVVSYAGFVEGLSTETYLYDGATAKGYLKGNITLTFNPASATAQYTITPRLELTRDYVLSPITGTLTWSSGAATFLQPVVGDPQSKDYPLTGRFTGPTARELIGGIKLGYTSPIDGKSQTLGAAFIAKR